MKKASPTILQNVFPVILSNGIRIKRSREIVKSQKADFGLFNQEKILPNRNN